MCGELCPTCGSKCYYDGNHHGEMVPIQEPLRWGGYFTRIYPQFEGTEPTVEQILGSFTITKESDLGKQHPSPIGQTWAFRAPWSRPGEQWDSGGDYDEGLLEDRPWGRPVHWCRGDTCEPFVIENGIRRVPKPQNADPIWIYNGKENERNKVTRTPVEVIEAFYALPRPQRVETEFQVDQRVLVRRQDRTYEGVIVEKDGNKLRVQYSTSQGTFLVWKTPRSIRRLDQGRKRPCFACREYIEEENRWSGPTGKNADGFNLGKCTYCDGTKEVWE